MKKLSLCILLVTFFIQVKAQNLQGRVIDEITGKGIPFVSVGSVGTNNATVSNENGDFILKPPTYPIKLRASHISYLLVELNLAQNPDKLVISLKPATLTLNVVTIDPFQGQRVLKAALELATANATTNFYTNAFYRQLTTVNNKPTQIYELFYDLKWNTKRVQGWSAQQSRYAELKDGLAFSLNNQSYLTFSYSGYLMPEKGGKFVTLKNLGDFTITIDKYIEQASQKIAVVSCKYKKGKKNQYYVNSTYYIGIDDSKIYRLENNVYNLPISLSDATAKYPPAVTTVATFNGEGHPIPVLESVSTKFLITLAVKGQELNSGISSLLTVYKVDNDLKNQQFEALNRKTKDKKVIESIAYDSSFWKDNPIVKQTTLEDSFIKMMESKQAFGTMINP
ncbi:carboxypeptidase-like regulatory domain-containing protein [Pedobacter polaris]|uniref:Carboxypeptidase-like regulatory domain-containing protein n=1 Tax=Pedobacter polaris TaxID=2571273 RepID=A0A4U1CTX0_9SPHI|nr:carboxypeptidase-like regulatory domain-containing protein [Pedobacter polaris]TKC10560.1 carboxypeptidase-like regulatory domain-containing protein [Pedobacter polaris]